MIEYVTVVGGFAIVTATLLYYSNPNTKADKKKKKESNILQNKIDQQIIELYNLQQRVENLRINQAHKLTNIEVKVLDIYHNSNIQIPIEIIEDLHVQKLEDVGDIFKFIESQRKYWKLENSKVPFRKKDEK